MSEETNEHPATWDELAAKNTWDELAASTTWDEVSGSSAAPHDEEEKDDAR